MASGATDRWIAAATLAVCAAGLLYGITLDFLMVEDANVLFNRANNLRSGALFHYGGYLSIPPQLIARAVAGLPPLAQVAAYGLVAGAIMLTMLRYLARCGGGEALPLAVALYFLGCSALFFHNLTYALWPAAMVIMLVGHVATLERRRLRPAELGLIAALAGFSPLSAFAAAPFLLRGLRDRDRRDWAVVAGLVLTVAVLPDRSGGDTRVAGLADGFLRHLALCAADPWACLGAQPGLLPLAPAQIGGYAAALAVAAGAAAAALRALAPGAGRERAAALLAFLAGPLAILAVSFATVPPPLGVRHLFPCVVAAGVAVSALAGARAPALFAALAALMALPAAGALAWKAADGFPGKVAELRLLAAPPAEDTVLYRRRGDKIWSVLLAERRWDESDCRGDLPDIILEHDAYEAAVADAAAVIHCSARLGAVLVPADGLRVIGR